MASFHTIRSLGIYVLLAAAVALPVASALAQAPQGGAQALDGEQVKPPALLDRVLLDKPRGAEAPEALARWAMPLDEVLETVEPAELPEPGDAAQTGPLPQAAERLIDEADTLLGRGELFSAIRVLREAEVLAPDQAGVLRRLGVAYSQSGNRVRGTLYLKKAIKHDPDNAVALLLLSQHAAARGNLSQVIAYTDALRQAGQAVLADHSLAQALRQAGYATAAAQCLQRCIAALPAEPQQADDNKPDAIDPLIRRELTVLAVLKPELQAELGDLYVALGRHDAAEQTYAGIDLEQASDAAGLLGRRVYLALRRGDAEAALRLSGEQLGYTADGASSRQAIGYLLSQGLGREQIAVALEAQIEQAGASLALLSGLSEVAEPDRVMALAVAWLASGPQEPQAFGAVARMARFEDDNPDDAKPLAMLLSAALGEMRRSPGSARQYVQAVLDPVDAPICLLRALKQPALNEGQPDDALLPLLKAIAFEKAQRAEDAAEQYSRALRLEPDVSAQVRVPLARLQLERGEIEQAALVLEPLGEPETWEAFEVSARVVAQSGQPSRAIQMVDNWRRSNGADLASSLLRAELLALAGNPSGACNDIFRLIHETPDDIRIYEAGLRLIEQNLERFNSFNQAANLRSGIANLMQTNLPDAPRARIERAINIYDQPDRKEEAIELLRSVTRDEPGNTLAWLVLESVYREQGDADAADAAHRAWFKAGPPSINRVLQAAERAVTSGEMQRASSLLRRMLELEEQGVLPGPSMTDQLAGITVELMRSAEPDRDIEPLSLKMLRRFPDSVQLNNSLGYQWTVDDKNLLQAKAMIERALDKGGPNHAVLDSMAWVQYKLGAFEEAAKHQERALDALKQASQMTSQSLDASKAVLNDHMGDIQYRAGDTAAAIRHWQIALGARVDEEDMMRDPELRTLARRTQEKIKAVGDGQEPPLTPVPGPESHGPDGHPADRPPPANDAENPPEQAR